VEWCSRALRWSQVHRLAILGAHTKGGTNQDIFLTIPPFRALDQRGLGLDAFAQTKRNITQVLTPFSVALSFFPLHSVEILVAQVLKYSCRDSRGSSPRSTGTECIVAYGRRTTCLNMTVCVMELCGGSERGWFVGYRLPAMQSCPVMCRKEDEHMVPVMRTDPKVRGQRSQWKSIPTIPPPDHGPSHS